jgi:hypothetical protein
MEESSRAVTSDNRCDGIDVVVIVEFRLVVVLPQGKCERVLCCVVEITGKEGRRSFEYIPAATLDDEEFRRRFDHHLGPVGVTFLDEALMLGLEVLLVFLLVVESVPNSVIGEGG